MLGVCEAVGQLRLLVLGALDLRVALRRRAPEPPRARAPPAHGEFERFLAHRLDQRLELASPVPNSDHFSAQCVNVPFGQVPLLARPELQGGVAFDERAMTAVLALAERHQQDERRLGSRVLARVGI